MKKKIFLPIFFVILFGCSGSLLANFGLLSVGFAQEHAPPKQLKDALDMLFVCQGTPRMHFSQNQCSGACRFFSFVKCCCTYSYKDTARQNNDKIRQFFKTVKVMQLEMNTYLDKVGLICTFDKSMGLLSNYVLKIRIPSNNLSRVVQPDGRVLGGIQKHRNVSRIIGAQRIQDTIRKYNLNHVFVPKKYLYRIPGRPDDISDDNYIVVAERVGGVPLDSCLVKQEVANEIFRCTWESTIYNPSSKNILITPRGRFAFIDTECLLSGPSWYQTLWKAFAFHEAKYSFASGIVNPYLATGLLTKAMVSLAMQEQCKKLEKRHWLKMPYGKGVTLFQ